MRPRLIAITLAGLLFSAAAAHPANDPQGRWLSGSGNVVVRIEPCGGALCGTIVRVLANRSMDGGSAPMASRPGLGLKIMTDVRPTGAGHWRGRLYNRENGRTYDCDLALDGPDRMRVRGYVLLPLIGKTQVWRRAP